MSENPIITGVCAGNKDNLALKIANFELPFPNNYLGKVSSSNIVGLNLAEMKVVYITSVYDKLWKAN